MKNNGKHIFTKTQANIDTRVWLLLVIMGVLSTAVLAYKMINNVHCVPFDIISKGYSAGKVHSYYLGNTIQFYTSAAGNNDVVWDFGDKGKAKGDTVSHAFLHEGNFTVMAIVNGKCDATYKLTIVRLEPAKSTSNVSMDNPISGAEVLYTNEPAAFSCVLAADTYEWSVLNSPEFPTQNTPTASFLFPIAGTRIIELKLDGDPNKVFRKNVQVLMKQSATDPTTPTPSEMPTVPVLPPPTPPDNSKEEKEPTKPKVMIIPNEEFVNLFNQVTTGDKDLQSITQYLCLAEKTKVLLNGTEWDTVNGFVQKIYKKKRYDIKSVETVRDDNNCVTILKIKYKKRLL